MIWPLRKGLLLFNHNSFPLSLPWWVHHSSKLCTQGTQQSIIVTTNEESLYFSFFFCLFLFDILVYLLCTQWSNVFLERERKGKSVNEEKCQNFGEEECEKGKFLCLFDLSHFLRSTSGFCRKMRKHGWQLPYHPLQVTLAKIYLKDFDFEVKVWNFMGRWWLLLCSWLLGLLSTSSLLLLLATRFISTLPWAFTLLW